MLSKEEKKEIDSHRLQSPTAQGACIEALKTVQKYRGWVSDEGIADIAAYLSMSEAELDSVATFYNLIFRRPVGRHVIFICDSVTCWIMGYGGIRDRIQQRLGIGLGQTTADGRFTLLPIQCLGTCDHAPALLVDRETYRDLTPDAIDQILAKYP